MTKRRIRSHKGGRTCRAPEARMTPQERGRLDAVLEQRGMSYADWLADKVNEEITGGNEMAEKITSKTTLAQIKDYARADFGVELTNDQAREIKEKGTRGRVVWTPRRCTVVDGFTIVRGKIL